MPYAAKATVEHEYTGGHLELYVTFRKPMKLSSNPLATPPVYDVMPPLNLWKLICDGVAKTIVASEWLDLWTLLLSSQAIAAAPVYNTLKYNGPNIDLRTSWNKQWEAFGPIASTNVGPFVETDPLSWHVTDDQTAMAGTKSGTFIISTSGGIKGGQIEGTSFKIGANTLDTTEFAYLDGQDQAVKIASTVTHNMIVASIQITVTNGLLDVNRSMGAITNTYYTTERLYTTTTGTPASGIGAAFSLRTQSLGGAGKNTGYFAGTLYDVTSGAEIGEMIISPDWHNSQTGSFLRGIKIRATGANSADLYVPAGNVKIGGTATPAVPLDVVGAIKNTTTIEAGTGFRCGGTAAIADGTYTVGSKLTAGGVNGTITTKGGIITAIQQAT
jgi:hypothetical protein